MSIISKDFYERKTLKVAKELLGCKLTHVVEGKRLSGMIVEVEAYTQNDPACHAFRGKTPRAITLFKDAGLSYLYFIYGMYHCMNVVTEPFDTAGAVLIRALEPLENVSNTNGPGKLCRELKITKELNEIDLTDEKSPIFIEKYAKINKTDIIETTRIGIKQAVDFKWRFYIKDNKFVSKF